MVEQGCEEMIPVTPVEETTATTLAVVIICSIILMLEIIAGLFGNTAICFMVYKSKLLRTPVNALLVNLAIADIATTVSTSPIMLGSLYVTPVYNGTVDIYPEYSYLLAGTVHVSHIICGTVQLVTLVCISFERHQAIAKPFEKVQRVRRVKINIVMSWLLGIVNCFIAVGVFRDDLDIQDHFAPPLAMTLFSNFIVYVFIPFSFVCVFLILVFYAMILYMVKKHVETSSKLFKKKNKVAPKSPNVIADESADKKSATSNATEVSKLRKESLKAVEGTNSHVKRVFSIPINSPDNKALINPENSNSSDITQDVIDSMRKFNLVPIKWQGNKEKLKLLEVNNMMEDLDMLASSSNRSLVQRRSTGFLARTKRQRSLPNSAATKKTHNHPRRASYHIGINIANHVTVDYGKQTPLNKDGRANRVGVSRRRSEGNINVRAVPDRAPKSTPDDKLTALNGQPENTKITKDPVENIRRNKTEEANTGRISVHLPVANDVPKITDTKEIPTNLAPEQSKLGVPVNRVSAGGGPEASHSDNFSSADSQSPNNTQLLLLPNECGQSISSAASDHGESGSATRPANILQNTKGDKVDKNESKGEEWAQPVIEVCDMDGGKVQVVATQSEVVGSICVMNTANKERGKRRVEAKTAKTSAIVISAFLLCWLPFSIVVVAGRARQVRILDNLVVTGMDRWFVVSLSLAILGAAINPIAYGVFNKQFRNELSKLVKKFKKQRQAKK